MDCQSPCLLKLHAPVLFSNLEKVRSLEKKKLEMLTGKTFLALVLLKIDSELKNVTYFETPKGR